MRKETRILVADDEPQMQLAIHAALSRAGHDVTIVSDGKKALDALEQDSFDLIVTDQRMPEMTGLLPRISSVQSIGF